MKGKYMGIRKLIIPTLTAIILLSGCGQKMSNSEILDMLNTGDTVTIELAIDTEKDSDGFQIISIDWTELGSQTTSNDVRTIIEDYFKITGNTSNKNGCIYVDATGENTQNNTLAVVMKNQAFNSLFSKTDDLETLNDNLSVIYNDAELGDEDTIYAAISDYFELLPAGENGNSNMFDSLSRAEAMTMVMRATTPVDDSLSVDTEFSNEVGNTQYDKFAGLVDDKAFVNTDDGSLNTTTYKENMTVAEFVYLVDSVVYGQDTITNTKANELNGVSNAGDLASKNNIELGTKQLHSALVKDFVSNPTNGLDEELYKAVVLADSKGIIDTVDNLDSAITKGQAVKILCKALQSNESIKSFNYNSGTVESGPSEETQTAGDVYVPTEEDLEVEDEATQAIAEAEKADEEVATTETTEAAYTVVSMDAVTMYAQQSVNLRQGPGTEYDKIGSLSTNQSVTVNGYAELGNKWYQLINADGTVKGYVSANYVKDTQVKITNNNNSSNSGQSTNSNSTSQSTPSNDSSSSETVVSGSGSGTADGSSRGNRSGSNLDYTDASAGGNLH